MSRRLVLGALLVAGLVAGCASGHHPSTESAATTPGLGEEVAAPAGQQVLFDLRGAASNSGGRLALTRVDHVLAFTDRPARTAGRWPAALLVDAWAALDFDTDPPNAAIDTAGAAFVVELGDPAFDATTATLSFSMRSVPGGGTVPDGDLGTAVLVIDDGSVQTCQHAGGPAPSAITYVVGDPDTTTDGGCEAVQTIMRQAVMLNGPFEVATPTAFTPPLYPGWTYTIEMNPATTAWVRAWGPGGILGYTTMNAAPSWCAVTPKC